jgi:ribosomal protein S18 acetylase RimI-like enzyme
MAETLAIVRSNQPTLELAQLAQTIGLEAWQDMVPARAESVLNTFDPNDPSKTKLLFESMDQQTGRFFGLVAYIAGSAVGYIMVHEETSKLPLIKAYGSIRGHLANVRISQINVLPEFQNKGIGRLLIRGALEQYEAFQKVKANVPAENNEAFEWFIKLGFISKNFPTNNYDWYGNIVDEQQHRLLAPNVWSVLATIQDLSRPKLYEIKLSDD